MSKILIVGDSPSSKLMQFAIEQECEVVMCADEDERMTHDGSLRLKERRPPNR